MTMEWIVIAVPVAALLASGYLEWRWRRETKEVCVTALVLAYRRKVRLTEAALLLVGMAALVYVMEYVAGMELDSFQCMFLIGMTFGFSKTFFEPYYGVGVISELDGEVLYLRSFEADRKSVLKNRNAFTTDFLLIPEKIEKTICKELRMKVGPVFAIGDPNTASPTTQEASSIYADDHDWQGAVAELARKAKVILLRVGDTDGCRWEVTHCLGMEYLHKMMFLVDSEDGLRILAAHVPVKLPEEVWTSDFHKAAMGLYIDSDGVWQCRRLPSRMAVRNFVAGYLSSYPEKGKPVMGFKDILKVKPESVWWDRLILLENPVAYCLYNGWRKGISIAMIIYMLAVVWIVAICMYIISDDDEYVAALVLFGLPLLLLSALPWLWFAPKYTCAINSWGGAKLTAKANKMLALWLLFYMAVSVLLTIIFYLE